MKTILELNLPETQSALKSGALEAFVNAVNWEAPADAVTTSQTDSAAPPAPSQTPAPAPEQTAAPTEEIAYTFDQIQKAAVMVARAGKRTELEQVLHDLGVQSLLELQPAQFNLFAAKIRDLGGVL
ncbi:hypothetical protein ACQRBK_07140 [Peptoniphilaceae bacterium SGI.137]|nr:hypothetical protein [Peptoniphilaceae bacterium]